MVRRRKEDIADHARVPINAGLVRYWIKEIRSGDKDRIDGAATQMSVMASVATDRYVKVVNKLSETLAQIHNDSIRIEGEPEMKPAEFIKAAHTLMLTNLNFGGGYDPY